MATKDPQPPHAIPRPLTRTVHGLLLSDEYAWLEDRDNPETLAYLEAENGYAEALLAEHAPLREQLYHELRGRIKEQDRSVPVRRGPYFYYQRNEADHEHALFCRQWAPDGPEELLLDLNALAANHAYCQLGPCAPSPDHGLLAYGLDTTGAKIYTLAIKDLQSGALLPEQIPNVAWNIAWGEDGRSLYYTTFDQAHRAYRLYRHTLGHDPAEDELLYEEADERFSLTLRKTRSGAFLLLNLFSFDCSEVRYKPADDPAAPFVVFDQRQPQVQYQLEHQGDNFLIVSNAEAENFCVRIAAVADPSQRCVLLPHRPDVLIDGVDAFANHLVVYERRAGLQQLRISAPDGTNVRYVRFPESVYKFYPEGNFEYTSDSVRFVYSSLVTPRSVIDYELQKGRWQLRKRDEIPSGYDPARYVAERIEASAPDGALVPMSLVRRRETPQDGTAPALLVGYGAYGMSYDPGFNPHWISLLDRGFVCAIAHVRGGQELGRAWYEAGRLTNKKNSFSDFIACAEHLIEHGYTSAARLAISGTSAGGLLVSAVVNMRPDLFRAVIARVPFTNVISAMLNPELPLTIGEYEQWGDPAVAEQFHAMRDYSSYDQISAQAYPHILATAGLYDLQVPYWDPAKWVARLRARKTDSNMLLLRTNMQAGHSGASGRFAILEELAFEYAFLLEALGGGA
ncbi:S9 family peptidase [Candidatus Viridilinea mediisalina]|uniref:Oligopeptidase B n=1 Tax=Candidatus Viridilinea mediisalina TaxID=2024553 RepID=A0A2A6RKA1_9CHLR|nr:S9 family peptidase [Candidatus Viridilinea mediisalina]PDW03383.1 oligopeptidase B [Candidatus Viridilinea mediisalina]